MKLKQILSKDWYNENSQCQKCTSFQEGESGQGLCTEAKSEVPATAHVRFLPIT